MKSHHHHHDYRYDSFRYQHETMAKTRSFYLWSMIRKYLHSKSLTLSICILLFMLILLFTITMLILTQILLFQTNSNSIQTIYNFSGNILLGKLSGSSSKSRSLEDFLKQIRNHSESSIDDGFLSSSLDVAGAMPSNFNVNDDDDNEEQENEELDHWQRIRSSNNKFFIFSAYIDSLNRSNMNNNYLDYLDPKKDQLDYFVRLIAVTELTSKEKIICVYHTKHPNPWHHRRGGNQSSTSASLSWFREGRMKPIREHWNLQFSAYFIYCPIPKYLVQISTLKNEWKKNKVNRAKKQRTRIKLNGQLSVIALNTLWKFDGDNINTLLKHYAQSWKNIVPSNRILVHPWYEPIKNNEDQVEAGSSSWVSSTRPGKKKKNNKKKIDQKDTTSVEEKRIAVCVKPLHYGYNKTINLMEFIELNRLLGAERFYFYNHTIGHQVDRLLRMYRRMEPESIRILQWNLPLKSQTEIRTEGIFASINDCLYRAKWNGFTQVIFIDLDEFIIPYQHDNLLSLLDDVQHVYLGKVGGFSFRNGFFYLQYPDDPLESIEHNDAISDDDDNRPPPLLAKHLVTLTKTLRKPELNIHKQRSKCIVNVADVVEMGNHFVWEFTNGKQTLNVDPQIAYLHHYRVCEFGGNGCVYKSKPIKDSRAHFWSRMLLRSMEQHIRWFCSNSTNIDTIDVCNLLPPN